MTITLIHKQKNGIKRPNQSTLEDIIPIRFFKNSAEPNSIKCLDTLSYSQGPVLYFMPEKEFCIANDETARLYNLIFDFLMNLACFRDPIYSFLTGFQNLNDSESITTRFNYLIKNIKEIGENTKKYEKMTTLKSSIKSSREPISKILAEKSYCGISPEKEYDLLVKYQKKINF